MSPFGHPPSTQIAICIKASLRFGTERAELPVTLRFAATRTRLKLDLDVNTGGEVELHELVDGLGREVGDVNKALVSAGLEVLARVGVDVGRAEDTVNPAPGGKGNGSGNLGAGGASGLSNLSTSLADQVGIVGLELNPNLLRSGLGGSTSLKVTLADIFTALHVGYQDTTLGKKIEDEISFTRMREYEAFAFSRSKANNLVAELLIGINQYQNSKCVHKKPDLSTIGQKLALIVAR